MFVFDANGRVQKVTEGIRFYEQDILCSSYGFSGDQKIDLKIKYNTTGFGIAIIEDNEIRPATQESDGYLFKIGTNDFRVFQRKRSKQSEVLVTTCLLEPTGDEVHLTFELAGKKVILTHHTFNSKNEVVDKVIGEHKLSTTFNKFRIGFYSNAGNIIKSLVFMQSIPHHWHVSTKNTVGGHIAFTRDTIKIENCEKYAEIEQDNIELPAGVYWLNYTTEVVNSECDVEAYMFYSQGETADESELEDDKKNLLIGNKLTLDKDSKVSLKFKAHNGYIKNIFLMNNEHSEFIETTGKIEYQEGSEIRITLKDLVSAEWTAVVSAVPPWEDMMAKCPYAILDVTRRRYSKEDLNIQLNTYYKYFYNVSDNKLTITNPKTEEIIFEDIVPLTTADKNIITIMKNVTMTMTNLVLTGSNGASSDVVIQKVSKYFVPAEIDSPIIVTDADNSYSFDISASYREVVNPKQKIALFSRERSLLLTEELPVNAHDIVVYGVPSGSRIDTSATDIKSFSSSYVIIPEEQYKFSGKFLTIKDSVRNIYEYLAIQYNSIAEYTYEFTNYERETFDGTSSTINLSKAISKNNEDIILYGIPKDATVHEEYLYRVPSSSLMTSIDYYADAYDEVPGSMYTVDIINNSLVLKAGIVGVYDHFVLDYLKNDSYAINYRSSNQQYEVDVATDQKTVNLHYDMRDDGTIYKYRRTDIAPNSSKYVILREKGEEDESEDSAT